MNRPTIEEALIATNYEWIGNEAWHRIDADGRRR